MILIRFLILVFLLGGESYANNHVQVKLNKYIQDLEKKYKCRVGLSVHTIPLGETLEYRAQEKFQMASIVKLPLVAYLAYLNDKNQLNFDEEVSVSNKDLSPGTGSLYYYTQWHPLKISIKNLIEAMLTISDNTATDILFEKVGGPLKVKEYMNSIGLSDIDITHDIYQLFLNSNGMKNIEEFKKHRLEHYTKAKSQLKIEDRMKHHDIFHSNLYNTATPSTVTNLLKKIINKEMISVSNSELILDILSRCATSSRKIRRFITSDFNIQDKTGTWFYDINPKYSYSNNVGIINLPNSEDKIILSIFVSSDKYTTIKNLNEVVAIITKTVIDYFYFSK